MARVIISEQNNKPPYYFYVIRPLINQYKSKLKKTLDKLMKCKELRVGVKRAAFISANIENDATVRNFATVSLDNFQV